MRAQLGMKGELALAVHRGHEGTAVTVEGYVHPSRGVRHLRVERGATQVDRIHASPHEIAHDAGFAGVPKPRLLAHEAAGAVGADQVAAAHLEALAGVPVFHTGGDAVRFLHRPMKEMCDYLRRKCVITQRR